MLDSQTTPNKTVEVTETKEQNPVMHTASSGESAHKEKVQPEFISFVSLFLIGVVAVLSVLLINEKRMQPQTEPQMEKMEEAVAVKYEMPQSKVIREVVQLPKPKLKGTMSVEEAIQVRRSKRFYSDEPVTLQELSQILWSAQGLTDDQGYRTAPSARGAYPFSLYVVVRNVESLEDGLYLYKPEDHTLGSLGMVNAGDRLTEAGVQDNSQKAPVVVALVAAPAKMLEKSPTSDPLPNIYLEGGHIGQNIYLEVESLKMATVVSGGFDKAAVAKALELDAKNETTVYLIPFGHIGEAPAEEASH